MRDFAPHRHCGSSLTGRTARGRHALPIAAATLLLALASLATAAIDKPDTATQADEDRRLHVLPWRADTATPAPPDADAALRLARAHLQSTAARSASPGADALRLIDQQRLRGGAHLLRFAPEREGVEIFGERISLLLDAQGRVRASSGGGRGATLVASDARVWRLGLEDAAAAALLPWGFDPTNLRGAWTDDARARAPSPYRQLQLAVLFSRAATGATLTEPVRGAPVWYRHRGQLRPGWYVETRVLPAQGPRTSRLQASLIDAVDGRLQRRQELSAHASFLWQAYAETAPAHRPEPGPQGRADMPHPTAAPDGFRPALGPPQQIELAFAPLAFAWPGGRFSDPWLRVRDAETRGNNVDAYADLAEPDGFSAGDVRAQLSGPLAFVPGYAPLLPPDVDKRQIEAGVVNAFYISNYLHNWFHAAGFDEAAGNAQMSNFDRGGEEFDELRVETLDHSGFDNANMSTPADGAPPRMQLFRFRGPRVGVLDPGAAGPPLRVRVAEFGPGSYRLSAPLALASDGVGNAADACEALPASFSGRIVLAEDEGCEALDKARHAQAAGAAGLVIMGMQAEGWPLLAGDAPELVLPTQSVQRSDALWLRERLAQAPLSVELRAERGADRDAAMDAAIVAHEWGHYISNRLIGNASGLSTHQSRAMGEGWADFHALLLLVREQDALKPEGAGFRGSYGVMNYVSAGRMPSFSPNASYFGIRRYPYSTRREINPLEFQHIASGSQIPDAAPRTPASLSADNSAVHNAGEVWGSLLWDCYASLLRETLPPTPRYSFDEAQRRMSEYLVAGYKLTPNAPTYTEARDALLLAMAVSDTEDLRLCGSAFAARGAGLRARSPSRSSLTLQGVQPSGVDGGDLRVDSIELIEDASCDADGVLDRGESGRLRLRVRNSGTQALADSRVDLRSSSDRLAFVEGSGRTLPALAPQQQRTLELPVALYAGAGLQAITVTATPDDPAIGFATGEVGAEAFAVDFDLVDAVSRSDAFDSPRLVWTPGQDEGLEPELVGWRRRALDPLRWVLYGPDFGTEGQAWVESPTLQVSAGADFRIEFDARYSFEASSSTFYDGGLVEFSVDEGQSWRDASELGQLSPAYGGVLSDCCDNPLEGRAAFVGRSAGWPEAFVPHRIDFGRSLAGQRVRLRFLIATDAAVTAPGWEIDEVRAVGVDNTPFPQRVPNAAACTLSGSFRDGFETLTQ